MCDGFSVMSLLQTNFKGHPRYASLNEDEGGVE